MLRGRVLRGRVFKGRVFKGRVLKGRVLKVGHSQVLRGQFQEAHAYVLYMRIHTCTYVYNKQGYIQQTRIYTLIKDIRMMPLVCDTREHVRTPRMSSTIRAAECSRCLCRSSKESRGDCRPQTQPGERKRTLHTKKYHSNLNHTIVN